MERYGITDALAFDRLRILSQHSNRKLNDTARDVGGGLDAGLTDGD